MEQNRFDDLARSFAAGSRRRFLSGLTAALGGAFVARGAGAQTTGCPEGQVNRRGIGCVCRNTGRPPVGGNCPCLSGQIEGTQCADGKVCIDGLCQGNSVCNASNAGASCGGAGCDFADFCWQTLEGGYVCVSGVDEGHRCTATSDCPDGRVCVSVVCNEGPCQACSTVCATAGAEFAAAGEAGGAVLLPIAGD